MKMHLTVLDPENPGQSFPPISQALTTPDGLLAVGGCLSTKRLLNAYRHGIFPWNSPEEPILWWSPNPRLVLFPDKLVVSRSLAKTLKKLKYAITIDRAFGEVVKACAQPRKEGLGTWITEGIYDAYIKLYHKGYAHSAEAWLNGNLVGGIYGVAIGRVFFGESMFHRETDASKVAFVKLVEKLKDWDYSVIDCQVSTEHLKSFGAEEIARDKFENLLNQYCDEAPQPQAWQTL
jgi:leucyl/phenylalanyl-tRNA---protein transferase